jgi:EAL domain-containing protein (putative c-di-GMP-specific phosphodiesterase class I)
MTRPDVVYAAIDCHDHNPPETDEHFDLDVNIDGRVPAARVPTTDGWGASTVVGLSASDLFVGDDALSARALFHRALDATGLDPSRLMLEITEWSVRVALDDLGCECGPGFHFDRPAPAPALVSSAIARTS